MQCYNCNKKSLKYDTEKDSYVCLHCGYEYPKQYFFISHSHLDIEKVRLIRNTIEETFFYEPILFFLKCLSDDNELQDLLQREISERIWFVYCKSKNAENSKYVQQERAYVNNLIEKGKKIHIIEIELDKYNVWNNKIYKYINNQIAFQIKKTKLFISYSNRDKAIFSELKDNLTAAGYSVWDVTNISAGESWLNSVTSHIKSHSYKDGAFLFIVSNNSINSQTITDEIHYALQQGAFILPVILDDGVAPVNNLQIFLNENFPELSNTNGLILRQHAIKEDVELLIKILKEL